MYNMCINQLILKEKMEFVTYRRLLVLSPDPEKGPKNSKIKLQAFYYLCKAQ